MINPAVQPVHTTEAARRATLIAMERTDMKRWSKPQSFEAEWNARAKRAADFIPAAASVLDLGCGMMALEKFLPDSCLYIPSDLVRRDERTILSNFNEGNFPDAAAQQADFITLLGVLEYVYDASAFLAHLRCWNRPILLSYCATEAIGETAKRRALGWVNDFSLADLSALFLAAGFSIQREESIDQIQWLFRLVPGVSALHPTKRVGVLSFNQIPNFGDRLNFHVLSDLMPATAEVTQLTFAQNYDSIESFDLLIVGAGHSIYASLLTKSLFSLIDRSRTAIGIFGTQYHAVLSQPLMRKLTDRLAHWYARYEDDLLRYGRGLQNATLLGDPLMQLFPMTRPVKTEALKIDGEIWNELPLDRAIQAIQRFPTVLSTRLHPLLCAMTSAQRVGYVEQRQQGYLSGKFRAMLIDVFGRTFQEGELFEVDRNAVIGYKHLVNERVQKLRVALKRIVDSI